MLLIKAKRVIKAGLLNFWRDGWISFANILIMVITLFVIGSLIFDRAVLSSTLDNLKNKVDISVYFKVGASEDEILSLKKSLLSLGEVKDVEYISREDALARFKERHADNALIGQSLDELGENPLGAVINIRAKEISQYEGIAKFLENSLKTESVDSIVDKINYYQNKIVIDRLSEIIQSSEKIGVVRSLILMIISILITFNTIRMAIYTGREEVGVMKLVGASNRFISGPFVIAGIVYGIISAIITMLIFYPLTSKFGAMFLSGPFASFAFSDINAYDYYIANFSQLFLILLSTGVFLGAVSSFIAVRRYLKV